MKIVCAWCRSEIASGASGNDSVSHGICRNCSTNIIFQQGVNLPTYIESLDSSIVVVNSLGEVLAANANACETLATGFTHTGKPVLTGDVFECQYARLPEGCGRTIHCSGCAIRRAIEKTLETGEPQSMIPATLRRKDPDHPEAVSLYITTVKSGDAVLLKIEHRDNDAPSRPK
jgi:hypothetical protein